MSPSSVIERDRRRAVAAVPTLQPGQYLAVEDGDEMSVIPLTAEITRIGRAIAAHIRLDDPTVSRRHALIHLEGQAIRLLDDRSLNGDWVNGERVGCRELADDDEVTHGRFRLYLLRVGQAAQVGATAA